MNSLNLQNILFLILFLNIVSKANDNTDSISNCHPFSLNELTNYAYVFKVTKVKKLKSSREEYIVLREIINIPHSPSYLGKKVFIHDKKDDQKDIDKLLSTINKSIVRPPYHHCPQYPELKDTMIFFVRPDHARKGQWLTDRFTTVIEYGYEGIELESNIFGLSKK